MNQATHCGVTHHSASPALHTSEPPWLPFSYTSHGQQSRANRITRRHQRYRVRRASTPDNDDDDKERHELLRRSESHVGVERRLMRVIGDERVSSATNRAITIATTQRKGDEGAGRRCGERVENKGGRRSTEMARREGTNTKDTKRRRRRCVDEPQSGPRVDGHARKAAQRTTFIVQDVHVELQATGRRLSGLGGKLLDSGKAVQLYGQIRTDLPSDDRARAGSLSGAVTNLRRRPSSRPSNVGSRLRLGFEANQ